MTFVQDHRSALQGELRAAALECGTELAARLVGPGLVWPPLPSGVPHHIAGEETEGDTACLLGLSAGFSLV